MRGTDANEQIRDRLASQRDDLEPDDIDVVQTGSGLQARIDGDARNVDPQDATERARERGVGDDPDALDRLDGDADRGVSVTRPGGQGGVATGAPEPEPATVDVQVGQQDRGVGVTRGPEGTTVVRPELTGSDVTRTGQQQLDAQQSPSAGEVRASVNRFGQAQLDGRRAATEGRELIDPEADPDRTRPLVEPPQAGPVELLTGQAGGSQLERGLINEGLETVGLAEAFGFRRAARGQADPDPSGRDPLSFARAGSERREQALLNDILPAGDAREVVGFRETGPEQSDPDPRGREPLSFARGAGPERQRDVERDTVGDAIATAVTGRTAGALGTAGVVAPEPVTTAAGGALLGIGAATAASSAVGAENRGVLSTSRRSELDVPEREAPPELETPSDPSLQRSELDTPSGDEGGEVAVPTDGALFPGELDPEEAGEPTEVPLPTEGGDDSATGDAGGDTVVPGDFPLAGRDRPADPSREFVPGERPSAATAEATPVGQQRPRGEREEAEEDDGLGVPDDDPFRVSDRRLFDPNREFGDPTSPTTNVEEETPGEIDDIGGGIAGEGGAIDPARGETVAENFERFLLEREQERQEAAQRQEVLVEESRPGVIEEAFGRPAEAEGARQDSAFGDADLAGELVSGIRGRAESAELPFFADADADARQRSRERIDTDGRERLDEQLREDSAAESRPLSPSAETLATPVFETPAEASLSTSPQSQQASLTQPSLLETSTNILEPTTPVTAPAGTPTPESERPPQRPGGERDDDDDDPLAGTIGAASEEFVNPVATAEDFLGGEEF